MVVVGVRVRPYPRPVTNKTRDLDSAVRVVEESGTVIAGRHRLVVDAASDGKACATDAFKRIGEPFVNSVLSNSSAQNGVFLHFGHSLSVRSASPTSEPSILEQLVESCFAALCGCEYRTSVSAVSISHDSVVDLLRSDNDADRRPNRVCEETIIDDADQMLAVLESALDQRRRTVRSGGRNVRSAAHFVAILRFALGSDSKNGNPRSIALVQICEPQAGIAEQMRFSSQSLLALSKVVKLASSGAARTGVHVPFRDSKLTSALKPLFEENPCQVAVLSDINANSANKPQTVVALEFCLKVQSGYHSKKTRGAAQALGPQAAQNSVKTTIVRKLSEDSSEYKCREDDQRADKSSAFLKLEPDSLVQSSVWPGALAGNDAYNSNDHFFERERLERDNHSKAVLIRKLALESIEKSESIRRLVKENEALSSKARVHEENDSIIQQLMAQCVEQDRALEAREKTIARLNSQHGSLSTLTELLQFHTRSQLVQSELKSRFSLQASPQNDRRKQRRSRISLSDAPEIAHLEITIGTSWQKRRISTLEQEMRSKIAEAEQRSLAHRSKVTALEKALKTLEANFSKEMLSLKQALQEALRDVKGKDAQVIHQAEELENLSRALSQAQAQALSENCGVQALSQDLSEERARTNALGAQVAYFEEQLRNVKGQLASANNSQEHAKDQLEVSQQNLIAVKAEHYQQVQVLNTRVRAAENALVDRDCLVALTTRQLAETLAELEQANFYVEEQKALQSVLELGSIRQERRLCAMRAATLALEKQIKKHLEAVPQSQAPSPENPVIAFEKQLEQKLGRAEKNLGAKHQELFHSQQLVCEQEEKIVELRCRVSALSVTRSHLQDDVDHAVLSANRNEKNLHSLQVKLEQTSKEAESVKLESARKSEELRLSKEQNVQLENRLRVLETKLVTEQVRFRTLKNACEQLEEDKAAVGKLFEANRMQSVHIQLSSKSVERLTEQVGALTDQLTGRSSSALEKTTGRQKVECSSQTEKPVDQCSHDKGDARSNKAIRIKLEAFWWNRLLEKARKDASAALERETAAIRSQRECEKQLKATKEGHTRIEERLAEVLVELSARKDVNETLAASYQEAQQVLQVEQKLNSELKKVSKAKEVMHKRLVKDLEATKQQVDKLECERAQATEKFHLHILKMAEKLHSEHVDKLTRQIDHFLAEKNGVQDKVLEALVDFRNTFQGSTVAPLVENTNCQVVRDTGAPHCNTPYSGGIVGEILRYERQLQQQQQQCSSPLECSLD